MFFHIGALKLFSWAFSFNEFGIAASFFYLCLDNCQKSKEAYVRDFTFLKNFAKDSPALFWCIF